VHDVTLSKTPESRNSFAETVRERAFWTVDAQRKSGMGLPHSTTLARCSRDFELAQGFGVWRPVPRWLLSLVSLRK
jgi:hypothetical protein